MENPNINNEIELLRALRMSDATNTFDLSDVELDDMKISAGDLLQKYFENVERAAEEEAEAEYAEDEDIEDIGEENEEGELGDEDYGREGEGDDDDSFDDDDDDDEEDDGRRRVCYCLPCKKKKKKPIVSLWRIYFTDPKQIPLLLIGLFMAACHGFVLPVFFIIFGEMYNTFTEGPDEIRDAAEIVAICFAGLGVFSLVVIYFEMAAMYTVGENICRKLRVQLFEALLHKDISFFDRHQTGELTAHLSGDIAAVQSGITDKVAQVTMYMAQLLMSIGVAFFYGWELTLILLALSPLIIVAGAVQGAVLKRTAKSGQQAVLLSTNIANEALSGIRTVLSFGMERSMAKRYKDALAKPTKIGKRRAHFIGLGLGFSFCAMFGTYALGFWYGSNMVADGEMDIGDLIVVFFSIFMGAAGVGQAGQTTPDITKAKAAATQIFETIETPIFIDPNTDTGVTLDESEIKGEIEFKRVEFAYPERPEVQVFKRMNLRIPAGNSLALVGPSGSGKSTVISLAMRFYDVADGSVTIDGVDIKDFDLYWLRSQIGLVSQEPILFSCSIAENILFGKPDASMEEVMDAAKAANAHDFIQNLPDGYNTTVGEKGCMLSGGQKQRIAIARAILKNPKILLLDEATSALDTESEHLVQEALTRLMAGRTTIIIAHRLATVRNANTIAVMEKGRIVEMGTHDGLLKTGKVYRHLVERQLAQDARSRVEKKKRKKHKKAKKKKQKKSEQKTKTMTAKERVNQLKRSLSRSLSRHNILTWSRGSNSTIVRDNNRDELTRSSGSHNISRDRNRDALRRSSGSHSTITRERNRDALARSKVGSSQ